MILGHSLAIAAAAIHEVSLMTREAAMKVSLGKLILTVCLLAGSAPSWAAEGGSICDSVLLDKTISVTNLTSQQQMSYISLVTQDTYESKKSSLNLLVPDIASGSWDAFNDKRTNYLNSKNFQLSTFESRQELLIDPNTAINAWSDCIRNTQGNGLFTYVRHVSPETATITVVWHPQPPPQPLKKIQVDLVGGTSSLQNETVIDNGEHEYIIKRASGTAVTGTIRGRTGNWFLGNGAYTTDIYIPEVVAAPQQPEKPCVKMDASNTFCVHCIVDGISQSSLGRSDAIPLLCRKLKPAEKYQVRVTGSMVADTHERNVGTCLVAILEDENGTTLAQQPQVCDPPGQAADNGKHIEIIAPGFVRADNNGELEQRLQFTSDQSGHATPVHVWATNWSVCLAGSLCN